MFDIPKRQIALEVSAEELDRRRTLAMNANDGAWQPARPRARRVSAALQAYAALTTSAAHGAVRDVSRAMRR